MYNSDSWVGAGGSYEFNCSRAELLWWLCSVSITVVCITTDIFNRCTFSFGNLVQNTDQREKLVQYLSL